MFGRKIKGKFVLRVSNCQEGKDQRRKTKAIQPQQTGPRSTTGPSSKHGSARPVADGRSVSDAYTRDRRTQPDRSSAVRWIWSDGRERFGRLVRVVTQRTRGAAA